MNLGKKNSRGAEYTERQRAIRTCRKHFEDLRRAHKFPPADVPLKSAGPPRFLEPVARSSYQTSPAELCSEIGE